MTRSMPGLSVALCLSALSLMGASAADAACGHFKAVIRDVKVIRAIGGATEVAQSDSQVCAGDRIVAGKDARANIVMDDGNSLFISPDTTVALESYDSKKIALNLVGGKMRASIAMDNKYDDKQNTFQVKTKSAVAGVRGTDFLTSFSPTTGKTEVVTFSGRVDVGLLGANGMITNAVSVLPGQKTENSAGRPPLAPQAVPAQELRRLDSGTTAPPAQAAGSRGDQRAPAAARGSALGGGKSTGSMVTPADSSGGQRMKTPDFPTAARSELPTVRTPPGPPIAHTPPQIPFVNQAVQTGGPAHVKVNIRPHE